MLMVAPKLRDGWPAPNQVQEFIVFDYDECYVHNPMSNTNNMKRDEKWRTSAKDLDIDRLELPKIP